MVDLGSVYRDCWGFVGRHCMPSILMEILLLLLLCSTPAVNAYSKDLGLKCYIDEKAEKFTYCDRNHKTCYTKLQGDGDRMRLIGRGCSSRPGVLHTQCDSHHSGSNSEVFCYCGYNLCNASATSHPLPLMIQLFLLLTSALSMSILLSLA